MSENTISHTEIDNPTQPNEGWEGLAETSAGWPDDHEGLQLLKKNHVDRILGERGLGHLIVSKETSAGANFLHKQNPRLNASPDVENTVNFLRQQGAKVPDKPGKRLEAYLDFMADSEYVNDGILTGDKESIDRQIDAIIIKPEGVPESYFELQKRIAREQGHGDIYISDHMRKTMIETLRSEQRASLERWATYLSNPTNEVSYPDWFRLYAFDGVQKLGSFDKKRGEFRKRSKDTTAPFADLNPEALAYVLDSLSTHQHGAQVDDSDLSNLVKSGNFAKLYANTLFRSTADPERAKSTDGSWQKFEQIHRSYDEPESMGIHPTAQKLADSLQGHGTTWCTAGETTAQGQLRGGDFYVYYSEDSEGNDAVPRIAIRMHNGEVAEVRGVAEDQNLEEEMIDIAREKFRGLPGGDKYEKKAEDMRRLTEIGRKMETNPHVELSTEDLRFLYELDDQIESFSSRLDAWGEPVPDPRIDKLVLKRSCAEDMKQIVGSRNLLEMFQAVSKIDFYDRRRLVRGSIPELCRTEGINSVIEAMHNTGTLDDLVRIRLDGIDVSELSQESIDHFLAYFMSRTGDSLDEQPMLDWEADLMGFGAEEKSAHNDEIIRRNLHKRREIAEENFWQWLLRD